MIAARGRVASSSMCYTVVLLEPQRINYHHPWSVQLLFHYVIVSLAGLLLGQAACLRLTGFLQEVSTIFIWSYGALKKTIKRLFGWHTVKLWYRNLDQQMIGFVLPTPRLFS